MRLGGWNKIKKQEKNQIVAAKSAVSLLNYVFTQKDSLKKIALPEKNVCENNNSQGNFNNLIFELETMQKCFLDGIYNHIENNKNKFDEAKKMIENFITCDGKPIVFKDLINMVISCNEKIILRINGMRGTGKSTLFTLVYYELKKHLRFSIID